jgi:hypothetical protein
VNPPSSCGGGGGGGGREVGGGGGGEEGARQLHDGERAQGAKQRAIERH